MKILNAWKYSKFRDLSFITSLWGACCGRQILSRAALVIWPTLKSSGFAPIKKQMRRSCSWILASLLTYIQITKYKTTPWQICHFAHRFPSVGVAHPMRKSMRGSVRLADFYDANVTNWYAGALGRRKVKKRNDLTRSARWGTPWQTIQFEINA